MDPRIGQGVLGLSGMGFPLTQLAIRRFGMGGALAVEALCGGLLARDVALLASGTQNRVRRGPAALLWLETMAGAVALLTGVRPLIDPQARARAVQARPDRFEAVRRTAIGAQFGLHTLRFRIYLQPDHGRRQANLPAAALSRKERVGLTIHRDLDKWLSPLGVWVMHRTGGWIARSINVDVLLLTTTGRRSARRRTVVLQFFPDGDAMVLAAANDGGASDPAWFLNLVASHSAQVEVNGRTIAVDAEELPADEAAAWWERIVQRDPSYARYARATTRTIPIVRLTAVAAP